MERIILSFRDRRRGMEGGILPFKDKRRVLRKGILYNSNKSRKYGGVFESFGQCDGRASCALAIGGLSVGRHQNMTTAVSGDCLWKDTL